MFIGIGCQLFQPRRSSTGGVPSLRTLLLSGTLTHGTPSSGTILRARTGETIASNVDGLTVDSPARTYDWDGTGDAGTTSDGLVGTLAGSPNSPHDSPVVVEAAVTAETPPTPTLVDATDIDPGDAWVSGTNPPYFGVIYPPDSDPDNAVDYNPVTGEGDQLRPIWRLDGGSWITGDWVPYDVDYLVDGLNPALDYLTDGSLDAGGLFEVKVQAGRDVGLATEALGDESEIWSDTLDDLTGVPETASEWNGTTGTNKSTWVTVSGTPALVAVGEAGFNGAPISVRATQGRTGKRQWQVTLTSIGTSYFWVGVDDGTTALGPGAIFPRPGATNSAGISLKLSIFDGAIYVGGSSVQSISTNLPATGDVITVSLDTAAGEVSFYRTRGGTTVQIGSTQSVSLSNWYANVGLENADTMTAKFDAGQDRTLDSGYVPYDN